MVCGTLASLAVVLCEIAGFHLMGRLVDVALGMESRGVSRIAFLVVGVIFMGVAAKYLSTSASGSLSARFLRGLRDELLRRVARARVGSVESLRSGDVISRLFN